MLKLVIEIPCPKSTDLPKSINSLNGSRKFTTWERHKWRGRVKAWTSPTWIFKPLTGVQMRLERHSLKEQDFDNLVGSFKWVIDALVYNKILFDDSPKHVISRDYKWVKAKKGEYKIVIELMGVEHEQDLPTNLRIKKRMSRPRGSRRYAGIGRSRRS